MGKHEKTALPKGSSSHLAWLKKYSLTLAAIALGFILFNFFFGYKAVDANNNIDGSWRHTLSGLRHSDQTLGVDVYFNYGPLLERFTTYPRDGDGLRDFAVGNLLFLVIFVSFAYALVVCFKRFNTRRNQLMAVGFIASLFLTVNELDTFFFFYLMLALLAVRLTTSLTSKLVILLGVELLSLYKFSFSISLLALSPLAFITLIDKRSLVKSGLQWLAAIAQFIGLYLLVTWEVSLGFLRYLYYGLINSLYYNEFMSLSYSLNKQYVLLFLAIFLLAAGLGAVLVLRVIIKRQFTRSKINHIAIILISVGVLFFVLKQSIIRSATDGHLLVFAPFFFILPGLILYYLNDRFKLSSKLSYKLVTLIIISCIVFNAAIFMKALSISFSGYLDSKAATASSVIENNRLSYSNFKSKASQSSASYRNRASEVSEIKDLLQKSNPPSKDIIVFGNTTILGELVGEGYNVIHMPFLQNYSAHPPQLFDQKYLRTLQDHPGALIFLEETEGSVDERFVAYELNELFQYVRLNYRVLVQDPDKRQYVLQPIAHKQESCSVVHTATAKEERPFPIPEFPIAQDQFVKMTVHVDTPLSEKIIASLVKKPVYKMVIVNDPGGRMDWRTTETTLEHGITVQPMYLNYHDAVKNIEFDLNHIVFSGGLTKNDGLTAEFQVCSFR